jgi:hypothetical protein
MTQLEESQLSKERLEDIIEYMKHITDESK